MYHECKVIFTPDVTREQAEAILAKHSSDGVMHTWQGQRQVGANLVSFAVATLPMAVTDALHAEESVVRVETIMTFRGARTKAECCGGG